MFRFLLKWMTRGALLAGMATALHSCGASHLYGDDDAFPVVSSASEADQQNGRRR